MKGNRCIELSYFTNLPESFWVLRFEIKKLSCKKRDICIPLYYLNSWYKVLTLT